MVKFVKTVWISRYGVLTLEKFESERNQVFTEEKWFEEADGQTIILYKIF